MNTMPRRSSVARTLGSWLAWVVMATAVTPVLGARPFATEDAGVVEPKSCELEAYIAGSEPKRGLRAHGRWVQLNCGVGGGTQVGLGNGSTTVDGAKDRLAAIVGKTSLYEGVEGQRPSVSVVYSLGATRAAGARWKRQGSSGTLVMTHASSHTNTWHANLGVLRDHAAHSTAATWALAWERVINSRLSTGLESYGAQRSAPWIGLGARWSLTQAISVDGSWAQQMNAQRQRAYTVGVKLGW